MQQTFDPAKCVCTLDNVFLKRLTRTLEKLSQRHIDYILTAIYYSDNFDKISRTHFMSLYETALMKSEEWIDVFKIKRIRCRDRL